MPANRPLLIVSSIALFAICFAAARIPSQAEDKPQNEPEQESPIEGFPNLVGSLKNTPGCLGVETAQTASGKSVIFAWFENKKAVLAFYDSDVHQQAMARFFPDADPGEPLKDVADDSGPILAIASITFADKPKFEETKLPVSQIAIELYAPLSGGLALGGRFAPDGVKVKGLVEHKPEQQSK